MGKTSYFKRCYDIGDPEGLRVSSPAPAEEAPAGLSPRPPRAGPAAPRLSRAGVTSGSAGKITVPARHVGRREAGGTRPLVTAKPGSRSRRCPAVLPSAIPRGPCDMRGPPLPGCGDVARRPLSPPSVQRWPAPSSHLAQGGESGVSGQEDGGLAARRPPLRLAPVACATVS